MNINIENNALGELNCSLLSSDVFTGLTYLKDEHKFEQLIDLCAVDYLHYGQEEWEGSAQATYGGFNRARSTMGENTLEDRARFAVVYHLLSLTENSV